MTSALSCMPLICCSIRLLLEVNVCVPRPKMQHVHLLVDEFQTPVDGHDCLSLVLLQQHGADLLVDVRIVVKDVELLHRPLAMSDELRLFYILS
jgi:hypothetical protein